MLRKRRIVLLLGVEPQVFEQHDAAFPSRVDRRLRLVADAVFRELHGPADQLRQPIGNGLSENSGSASWRLRCDASRITVASLSSKYTESSAATHESACRR